MAAGGVVLMRHAGPIKLFSIGSHRCGMLNFDPCTNSAAFAEDVQKRRQWHAFVEGVAHDPGDLPNVIEDLAAFLMPRATSAQSFGQ